MLLNTAEYSNMRLLYCWSSHVFERVKASLNRKNGDYTGLMLVHSYN